MLSIYFCHTIDSYIIHCRIEMLIAVVDPFVSAMHMDRRDDDFLDKLNHKVTTCFMFFLGFVHTFYQVCIDLTFCTICKVTGCGVVRDRVVWLNIYLQYMVFCNFISGA